jgi:hypothetical protein
MQDKDFDMQLKRAECPVKVGRGGAGVPFFGYPPGDY